MHGVFITGTSTNVGKTHVGVLLAKQLHRKDVHVIPRKPIESGCEKIGGELIPTDAIALMEAAEYKGTLSEVCPYRFEPPISPARAAYLTHRVLTTEQLIQTCVHGTGNGFLLVEGAGGLYSPLAQDGLNADLASGLNLPVILVANDELGCLNQVLLNVEAIKVRGLTLMAVVLNNIDDHEHEHMDNSADLRDKLECPLYTHDYNPNNDELPDELIEKLMKQAAVNKVVELVR